MNEFEEIQRLLRLKRYETPGEDFVEDFVARFRERQRAELLRQSARGLLWERVSLFLSDLISPKWTTAAATAASTATGSSVSLVRAVTGKTDNQYFSATGSTAVARLSMMRTTWARAAKGRSLSVA